MSEIKVHGKHVSFGKELIKRLIFITEGEHVTMRFASHLLDAVVDRFGTDAVYNKVDSKHFSVTVSVAVSKQFYGWLCGFGNMVKILSPSRIADDYKAHLQKVA